MRLAYFGGVLADIVDNARQYTVIPGNKVNGSGVLEKGVDILRRPMKMPQPVRGAGLNALRRPEWASRVCHGLLPRLHTLPKFV